MAWTVNGSTFASYVRDGEIVASFDALDLEGAHGRDWIDALPVSARPTGTPTGWPPRSPWPGTCPAS